MLLVDEAPEYDTYIGRYVFDSIEDLLKTGQLQVSTEAREELFTKNSYELSESFAEAMGDLDALNYLVGWCKKYGFKKLFIEFYKQGLENYHSKYAREGQEPRDTIKRK